MYVIGTEACSLPNSETPMSQQRIDAQQAFGNSVGTAFDDGDSTINDLITKLGGNPAGNTSSGDAGVATTGTLDTDTAGIPVIPSTSGPTQLPDINNPSSWSWPPSPQLLAGGGSGYRAPKGEQRNNRGYRYGSPKKNINTFPTSASGPPQGCPVIVPLVTAIPVPAEQPAQPQPVATPAPVPKPAAPAADCRTGNWCLDIRNGCVLSSQVSPEQLLACSQAGYAGNLNLFPAIAAAGGAGGGAFFGTPEPNPTPFTPGMSGFGDTAVQTANAGIFGNVLESIITAAATAAALAIILKQRKRS